MQNIKVKDMGHSTVNLNEREADSIDPKTKLDNGATQRQMSAFTRDILKGKELKEVNPAERSMINWILSSVFIVEPRPSADTHDKPYSVLSGSHRLTWLERNVQILREMAKAAKALAATSKGSAVTEHEAEAADYTAKADAWENFEISCAIVHPDDDDERRAIVAQGNADAPPSDTQVKQADESKFAAFYMRAPKAEYLYQIDPTKSDTVRKVKGSEAGWSSPVYQAETKMGGNTRVTYSALTRLGRHFDIPLSFFVGRLKIKPEVTPSLLVKETPSGEGSDRVKHLGEGLETRYIKARAEAFGDKAKLEEIRETFKAECLELMDASGDGTKALGNEPPRTKAERDADKIAKEREAEVAEKEEIVKTVNSRATYNFEKEACARVLHGAPAISAVIGNAMDLLSIVPESKYTSECLEALAAFKVAPNDNAVLLRAVKALADTLYMTLPFDANAVSKAPVIDVSNAGDHIDSDAMNAATSAKDVVAELGNAEKRAKKAKK